MERAKVLRQKSTAEKRKYRRKYAGNFHQRLSCQRSGVTAKKSVTTYGKTMHENENARRYNINRIKSFLSLLCGAPCRSTCYALHQVYLSVCLSVPRGQRSL